MADRAVPSDDLTGFAALGLSEPQFAGLALWRVLADYDFDTVLDVGGGAGEHADVFEAFGKHVTSVDYGKSVYFERRNAQREVIIGDFNRLDLPRRYDLVWCSHVLEHQLDAHHFLRRLHAATADMEALKAADLGGRTVEAVLTDKIATVGENMTLRRMVRIEGETVAAYVHNVVSEGLGKIGVLVALKGADNGIGKQIAMHIAATNPASLSEADLDPALVEREKAVLTEQARESGKPEQVIEKMIVGRMNKFYEEVTLLKQKFVINPDLTVGKAAAEAGVEVLGFARLAVGEGIEKVEEDFAAEVAKTAGL